MKTSINGPQPLTTAGILGRVLSNIHSWTNDLLLLGYTILATGFRTVAFQVASLRESLKADTTAPLPLMMITCPLMCAKIRAVIIPRRLINHITTLLDNN